MSTPIKPQIPTTHVDMILSCKNNTELDYLITYLYLHYANIASDDWMMTQLQQLADPNRRIEIDKTNFMNAKKIIEFWGRDKTPEEAADDMELFNKTFVKKN